MHSLGVSYSKEPPCMYTIPGYVLDSVNGEVAMLITSPVSSSCVGLTGMWAAKGTGTSFEAGSWTIILKIRQPAHEGTRCNRHISPQLRAIMILVWPACVQARSGSSLVKSGIRNPAELLDTIGVLETFKFSQLSDGDAAFSEWCLERHGDQLFSVDIKQS